MNKLLFLPESNDKSILRKKKSEADRLCESVIKGMQEKKASDIVMMDLREIKGAVADFFIMCSASSDKQVGAIADEVEEMVFKETKEYPWHVEGIENKEWILLDYVNVVVHVFQSGKRQFYGLEELWGDAKSSRFDLELSSQNFKS